MSLVIRQSENYLGKDRWEWSVWIDGPVEELASVDHVIYILHSSFNEPVRVIKDRSTNFRLNTSGWGTFTLHAKVIGLDGSETPLIHELRLHYPSGESTVA